MNTDTTPAETERRYMRWLAERASDTDETGELARAHLAGLVDLSWSARAESSAIRAAYTMARERFDRERKAGMLRPDGTRNLNMPASRARGGRGRPRR